MQRAQSSLAVRADSVSLLPASGIKSKIAPVLLLLRRLLLHCFKTKVVTLTLLLPGHVPWATMWIMRST